MYYWTEWGGTYEVYKKGPRGKRLYVNPGVEVRISNRIAGEFTLLDKYDPKNFTHLQEAR